MPAITFQLGKPRRELWEFFPDLSGASPKGNTYWSRVETCPREHALGNVIQLRPKRMKEALTLGIIFHYGMETYYNCLAKKLSQQEAERHVWEALAIVNEESGYEDMMKTVNRMLKAYWDTYVGLDKWRILAAEVPLEITDPVHYTTRLDLLVVDTVRKLTFAIEHKSASQITEGLLQGYQLNNQTLGHCYLAKNCIDFTGLPPFGGVIVNLVSKQKNPQCVRVEVPPSEAHLAEWERSISAYTKMLALYEQTGYPKALTKCAGYARGYSHCDFYDICLSRPDLSLDELKRHPPEGFERPTQARLKFELE